MREIPATRKIVTGKPLFYIAVCKPKAGKVWTIMQSEFTCFIKASTPDRCVALANTLLTDAWVHWYSPNNKFKLAVNWEIAAAEVWL